MIICGRSAERLAEAASKAPGLETLQGDVTTAEARERLVKDVVERFPNLNVVINNAGVQREVDLKDNEPWEDTREEIAINLDAPIHLSRLFVPHLLAKENPAIVMVTSGLSFVPIARVPVYCATKAGLHSYTLSLRLQLASTPIKVVEVIPPAVNTDLGGKGKHNFGAPLNEYCDATFAKLQEGALETTFGFSEKSSQAGPEQREQLMKMLNQVAH